MAPRGFNSTAFFLVAFVLCGVPVAQAQERAIIKSSLGHIDKLILKLKTDIKKNGDHTKSVPLQKQYAPVMGQDNTTVIAYKTCYFGEIQVGTPAQPFTVVFDTGSGHVLLPRSTCDTETCKKHRRYSSARSTSSKDITYDGSPLDPKAETRDQVVISFGTGKVTGVFVQDKICIGGAEPECAQMSMVQALDMSPDPFGSFAFDGVMGLGLNSLRLNPAFSFFGEMAKEHTQMLPQFSMFLSRHEDGMSAITFGGHDKDRASSEMEWAPVAMPELGYWLVAIKQVRIGDTILEECADGSCRAIVDTGTSLLGVPRVASRSMHRYLARPAPTGEGVDTSKIDCRQVPGQEIHFDLGDATISLPAEVYTRPAPINMTTNDTAGWSLFCRSLLLPVDMPAPVGPKVFIWGEPVLRHYLTVYDFEKKRVGFSIARQTDEPAAEDQSIGAPPEGSNLAGAPLPGTIKRKSASTTPETQVV